MRNLQIGAVKRSYRVGAGCFEPDIVQSIEERRKRLQSFLIGMLEKQHLDMVVLPETALTPDWDKRHNLGAEAIDGPTVADVSEIAERFGVNICIPIIEESGEKKYNTAVLLNREGRMVGKYRKHVPTRIEMELGICPGDLEPEPIMCDGLRVGVAICYDENYPDILWNYMKKEVDLLLFPSYTYAGKLMANWALTCAVPLICAFPWESIIYDRDGSILAEGGNWTTIVRFNNHPGWIACNLNMQSRVYHLDYNHTKIPDMLHRYGGKLDIRLMVKEARMQITVVSDDLTIEQVEAETQLIPLQKYITETRELADRLRAEDNI